MKTSADLAGLLQAFFTDRLMRQRKASPHTIASYRDTFRLLLRFVHCRIGKPPQELAIADLDVPLLVEFLDHLEKERGNCARSRNARLAALRSFFHYVAFQEPAYCGQIQRVLSIPSQRGDRRPIEFLTRPEIDALVAAPDPGSWSGRRDRTLLLLMAQTGLRVSEVTGLRCQDVVLDHGAHVRCRGKGRKERCTPLRKDAAGALRSWLQERRAAPTDPLFTAARTGPLSRDGIAYILAKHVATARQHCPSMRRKRISPHVLRHSAAMDLLHHGIDRSVIALWLGHECVETTQMYLHASLELKERALARTKPMDVPAGRYRPDDRVLAFLASL